jgi:threonine synthase
MDAFKAYGEYEFVDFDSSTFTSSRTTDTEIRNIITKLHQEYSYVADPHTACGLTNLDSGNPQVVLSTAHPAKFPETIVECIGSEPKHPSLEALKTMPVVKHKVASDVDAVKTFIRQSI